ncbi:MAG: hypothetical protein U1E42_06775 [Rhodospirillales bacterium]
MKQSRAVFFAFALLIPGLAGCMPVVGVAAGPGLAVGSTAATGKTPVDHLVSLISGKNCSVLRKTQGLTYCREDEPTIPIGVVCYRTLGDVACYNRSDPYNAHERPVIDARSVAVVPASERAVSVLPVDASVADAGISDPGIPNPRNQPENDE